MSMIIKEKDNNQQKVVANLKAQRDEQCLLKEAALQEIENLKTTAALSFADKNN